MTRYGTSYFNTLADAVAYYGILGDSPHDVEVKIQEGAINIGKPADRPGERLTLVEGRWHYVVD